MEKSLVLIKPDGVRRNLIGRIIAAYEAEGLVIDQLKKLSASREQVEEHYAEHREKPFYPGLLESLLSGDVVAMVISGPDAIQKIRSVNGATDPAKAAPGTLRALYGLELPENTVHSSDSPESVLRETAIWFPEEP